MQATDSAVRREITVNATPERAFAVFTERFDTWWPRSHSIGASRASSEAIIEPREGGRWYEQGVDGSDDRLGRGARLRPAAPARAQLAASAATGRSRRPRALQRDRGRPSRPRATATRVTLVHRHLERHDRRRGPARGASAATAGGTACWRLYAEASSG